MKKVLNYIVEEREKSHLKIKFIFIKFKIKKRLNFINLQLLTKCIILDG